MLAWRTRVVPDELPRPTISARACDLTQCLQGIRDALARKAGLTRGDLELDAQAVRKLLDVVRVAAHDSGQRINAPFLGRLIERAQGHTNTETLAEIVRAPEPA